MAEQSGEEQSPGVREQAHAMREDLAPSKLNARLEEVIEERPKTRHLLDFSIVGKALLAAAVVAVVLLILTSAQVAAIALVVVFVGGWLLGAQLSYDRRRETRDVRAREEDEEAGADDEGAEEDDSPPRQAEARRADPDSEEYAADRGEVEAEQEQEGKAGNGGDPRRGQRAER
jgi:hypothetical protein